MELAPTTPGRPAIAESRYHAQIEQWLNAGHALDAITGTNLQKAVGGSYKRACTILDNFKAGYEQKEMIQAPELSEAELQEANAMIQKLVRLIHRADLADMEELKENHRQTLMKQDEKIEALEQRIEELINSEDTLNQQLADAKDAQKLIGEEMIELNGQHQALITKHTDDHQELIQKREQVKQQEILLEEKNERISDLQSQVTQMMEMANPKPATKAKPKPKTGPAKKP